MRRFPSLSLPQRLDRGASPVFSGVLASSYARVGGTSAPANTTAGDLTCLRIAVGNTAFSVNHIMRADTPATGSTSLYGFRILSAVQNDVTTSYNAYATHLNTQAASFTLGNLRHFVASQDTIGAGSTVTAQAGFYASSTLTGAGTNYGYYSDIAAASFRWNFYANGTARNYMAGALGIGTTTDPGTSALLVVGSIKSNGATAGIGYATGAGGTVTQGTDKSTGVTLDKVTGTVTMHNATLNAGTTVGFVLTNSAIAATDVIVVNLKSGATADSYVVTVTAVAAGSCRIELRNTSAGNLGEAVVLSFAVIKGVAA